MSSKLGLVLGSDVKQSDLKKLEKGKLVTVLVSDILNPSLRVRNPYQHGFHTQKVSAVICEDLKIGFGYRWLIELKDGLIAEYCFDRRKSRIDIRKPNSNLSPALAAVIGSFDDIPTSTLEAEFASFVST